MPLPDLEALTPRELEVLALLRSGQPNKQIARQIGISDQTVKYHLKNIYVKLGAQGRAHAVALASGAEGEPEPPEPVPGDIPVGVDAPLSPLMLAARARRLHGGRQAVADGDLRFSYAEFFGRCDRWSAAMQVLGICPGDRVATVADNIHPHLEQFQAVPALGAIIVPINVRLSPEDFAYVLRHSGARMVCVSGQYLDVVDGIRPQLSDQTLFVSLEGARPGWLDYEALLAASDGCFEPAPIHDHDVISISYTSGTAFRPRGVMLTHRNVWLNAVGVLLHWPLGVHDRYLWTLPLAHCNGWGFAWTVTAAGACHICTRDRSTEGLVRLIRDERVTALAAGKVGLMQISECPVSLRRHLPRELRVLTAGSSPGAVSIERIERDLGWDVTHAYGLTETAPFVAFCDVQSLNEDDPGGRARFKARQGVSMMTAGELRVVDEEHCEVPADGRTVGEIVVRGGMVMKGYYDDDAATARAFAGGWFHSGDAAVMHPDGFIEICDRIKDVIISGDELVASIEVEDVLMRHAQVMEVAVVGVPDPALGESVHAFIVPRDRTLEDVHDLAEHAAGHLAPFKVPRHFHVVDLLPKTATGKVRKQLLREQVRGA